MPYIGNPIYQSAFVTDTFSGNGSTTAFTMSVAPAGTTNVLVVVSGVVQDPSTYGVVGNTLNFTAAPPSGTGNISCRYLGVPVTGVTTTAYRTVTEFTATAGQTTFTPPSYNVGFINVYLNGVLLGSADYTATNGTTVVLTTGASAGNLVTVESFSISSVANAIANAAGSVSSSNIQTSVALTTPTMTSPTISSGPLTIGTTALGAGNASIMKNRIINGAMVIDQRNAGASVTPTDSSYTLDRWFVRCSQASKFTIQQNAGSVTPPVGFSKYLGVTSTSAYSVASGDFFFNAQAIEGYNIADLGFGTASAKTITISFQVYSSLTGTFGGTLRNGANNRYCPFSYSIPVANTWTTISVTIAGDTTGTWASDNSAGLYLYFNLGTGSTYSGGTSGVWGSTAYFTPSGTVSVVGTSGATFYITGVQLEVGSSQTGYEYVNYQTSLANCQRYYAKLQNDGTGADIALGIGMQTTTASAPFYINFPVTMRSEPTAVITNLVASDFLAFSQAVTLSSINMGYNSGALNCTYSANGATYRPIYLAIANATSGNIALSAEL